MNVFNIYNVSFVKLLTIIIVDLSMFHFHTRTSEIICYTWVHKYSSFDHINISLTIKYSVPDYNTIYIRKIVMNTSVFDQCILRIEVL